MTGRGTDFTSVLRGQPDFPTKVRLSSNINTGDYEVVRVSGATSALLVGTFTAESDLKYSVVGTFTPGFIPSREDACIYEYDSCELRVVSSEDVPNITKGKEFIIACVDYLNTTMRLTDYRLYYMLNNPYVQTTDEKREYAENKLVSLVKASVVSINSKGLEIELHVQHGFRVTSFEVTALANGYAVDIVNGSSNIIDASRAIPNSIFRGWYLLNKSNMEYSVITDSSDKRLFISKMNPNSTVDGSDIVLVPPFNEIEFQVTVENNTPSPSVPYIFKRAVENIDSKLNLNILWPSVQDGFVSEVPIKLKYRMVGTTTDKYPLYNFVTANYVGIDGSRVQLVSGSSVTVSIGSLEPVETVRNYS